jgi:hypothetical protein
MRGKCLRNVLPNSSPSSTRLREIQGKVWAVTSSAKEFIQSTAHVGAPKAIKLLEARDAAHRLETAAMLKKAAGTVRTFNNAALCDLASEIESLIPHDYAAALEKRLKQAMTDEMKWAVELLGKYSDSPVHNILHRFEERLAANRLAASSGESSTAVVASSQCTCQVESNGPEYNLKYNKRCQVHGESRRPRRHE